MALIKCPECGNQVSTAAAACPHCGAPLSTKGAGTPPTTIQLTSKRLKAHALLFMLLVLVGIVWFFFTLGADETKPVPSAVAILMMLAGITGLVITKLCTWWHHK